MSAQIIRDTFREVHNHFVWAPDMEVFGEPEHWSSLADNVERGEVFKGDCDNFAMTCAELLLRRGIEPVNIRLALCWTETAEYHAVCIAHGELLDNRQRRLRHWASVPYRWHRSMRLDKPGEWRLAS
jgi:predicted transglutaminase-like cysteine proteinase